MDFPKEIFKAYDIRGLKEQVTAEIAEQLGRALVANLGGKTVLIGRDMRETSPMLAEAIKKGVTAMGGNVVDIGLTTTSMFNWALTSQGVDIGAMVTASHNPAAYNGIKVAKSTGDPVSGVELYSLVQDVFEDSQESGSVEVREVIDDYISAVIKEAGDLPDFSNINIAIDYGNGMGSVTVRPLMKALGIKPVELYPEPDATFPNHEANPANEETLEDLKVVVKDQNLDFGIALDGDVDRVKIIDNEGNSVPGELHLALLAEDLLKEHPGSSVVVTINMGWSVREAIKEAGGVVVESPVGRTNVAIKARESSAIIGGETSGHISFTNFADLEVVDYAIVRTLLLLKHSGKKMSELVNPLRIYANSGDVNNEVEDKDGVLKRLEEHYGSSANELITVDGVKCVFDDWWFITRKSNTEPVIRLTVEAKTEELMKEKVDEVSRFITEA